MDAYTHLYIWQLACTGLSKSDRTRLKAIAKLMPDRSAETQAKLMWMSALLEMSMAMKSKPMGVAEAAKELGVSLQQVYNMLERGDLAWWKVGKRKVISRASLEGYIEQHTNKKPLATVPAALEAKPTTKRRQLDRFRHYP